VPLSPAATRQQDVLDDLVAERAAQDERFGPATQRGYSIEYWLCVLVEEVGEVADALVERDYGQADLELVQAAATAVAMLEALRERSGR
jgi:NTP pyrophosphatase (non-canonical NTP hydrolase)